MGDLEPATMRLKLLRQGRGNGFRDALGAGHLAAGDVMACVLDDPRWDRQVEQRDEYYARLLLALAGDDIRALEERILDDAHEDDAADLWLPIGVLAEMVRRGHAQACEAIATAVRRGLRWRACLDALEAAGGETLIGAVVRAHDVEALIAGIDVDDLVAAVQTVAAPWAAWATRVPALRLVADAKTRHDQQPTAMSGPVHWAAARMRETTNPAITPSTTTAELLELAIAPGASRQVERILQTRTDEATMRLLRKAATTGAPEQRRVSLFILGERGCPDFVTEAEQFLRNESGLSHSERKEHRTRRAFLRYLEQLPAEITLEHARRWFTQPWPLSLAGEGILAQHATRDDRVMLEQAGAAALTSDDMYRLCSAVEALAVFGAIESLPFLAEVYSEAPYSQARRRAATALLPHATHDIARDLILEALWDCEAESRELACGAVSSRELHSARRLAEIADDEFEDPDVRTAVQRAR